jgi:hypothetical protein
MKNLLFLFIVIVISNSSSAQLKVTPADLCDDGYSFKNKSVTFKGSYSYAEQVGDKWGLRSKGQEYEKINSLIAYGLTSSNDNFYTRIIWADCKLILRIPYNITVPNSDQGVFTFTGKVSLVGKSYVMLEVASIKRLQ